MMMEELKNLSELNITDEDKVAMAEAYRVYELFQDEEKEKIPDNFVETLLYFGDFKKVKPFANVEEMKNANLSLKGKYLLMYMCTFEKQAI